MTTHQRLPFKLAPMATAVGMALASNVTVYFCRDLLFDGAVHADGFAYDDVMFAVLPDWHAVSGSLGWPQLLLRAYCFAFTVTALRVLVLHRLRWILVRRAALIFSVSQWLSIFSQFTTLMPDPDIAWRVGTFALYPVVFTVGALCCTFHRTGGRWHVVVALMAFAGILASLACHVQYTVDSLSMIAISSAVFFTFQWAFRSPDAVRRRSQWVQWFEQDLLNIASSLHSSDDAPSNSDQGPEQFETDKKTDRVLVPIVLARNLFPVEPPESFSTEFSASMSLDAQRSKSMIELASPIRQRLRHHRRCEKRLVLHIDRKMSERQKRFYPVVYVLGLLCVPFIAANLAIFGASITDKYRPLGRPPMVDYGFVLFDMIGVEMPHWTSDFLCYGTGVIAFIDVLLLQPFPLTAFRRAGTIWAICFLTRFFFVTSTFVTDPFPQCSEREHPDSPTCGDCIYSGHTIGFLTSAYCITAFRPSRRLRAIVGAYVTVCLSCVIATRMHYTRDVVMAAMVFAAYAHFLRAVVFSRPDRVAKNIFLLAYELDYYIARGRVLYGYKSKDESTLMSLEHFAPRSVWEALHPRHIFAVVRPTCKQSERFRKWGDAPLTNPPAALVTAVKG
jgi:hypothetical protein